MITLINAAQLFKCFADAEFFSYENTPDVYKSLQDLVVAYGRAINIL